MIKHRKPKQNVKSRFSLTSIRLIDSWLFSMQFLCKENVL